MKNNLHKNWMRDFACATSFAVLAAVAVGCSDSGNDVAGGASGDAGIIAISDKQIAGVAQKGPFVKGSNVVLKETSAKGNLEPTGREFFATTRSDEGDFVIDGISLESQFISLTATGYFKRENTGENSKCQVRLNALSDISNRDKVNINVLTHIEYGRILKLTEKGKSFDEAQKQAHGELFSALGRESAADDAENLDVTGSREDDRLLESFSTLVDECAFSLSAGGSDECLAGQEFMDVLAQAFARNGKLFDDLDHYETKIYSQQDMYLCLFSFQDFLESNAR